MTVRFPIKFMSFFCVLIIFNGFNNALSQTSVLDQTKQNGASTNAINFPESACVYNWTNSNPGIGLAASGTGNIASFKATNTSSAPVTATIIATPVAAQFAYIENQSSNTAPTGQVSVINLATNAVVTNIPVGLTPQGIDISPDGSRVYVTNFNSNTVSVINTSTNTVVSTITVGKMPLAVKVSPDGSKVYVTNSVDNTVSVIDAGTNTVVSVIGVGLSPYGIATNADGSRIYVANVGGNSISVISTSNNTTITTIPTNEPRGIILNHAGNTLYVTNLGNNTVSAVSTSTNTVTGIVNSGLAPFALAISPDDKKLYVTNQVDNTVSVINTATNLVTAIPYLSGPFGISITPDGTKVYVNDYVASEVSVINTATNTISSKVPVGVIPFSFGNFISTSLGCNGSPLTFKITVNPTLTPNLPAAPRFTYPTPDVYTINTPITPIGPTTLGGPVPATIFGKVNTFAGQDARGGYLDATGNAALFTSLWGIDIDAAGNLYVADGPRIRMITPGAVVSTLAGGNPNGLSDGTGTAAGFGQTAGLSVTAAGDIVVGDITNKSLRQITPRGVVTTIAGIGINNFDPAGVTTGSSGDIFVADQANDIIRDFVGGGPATIYGGTQGIAGSNNGTLAFSTFNHPADLKFDQAGDLFIADQNNNMIREISVGGIVTTVAGNLNPGLIGGPIASALFNQPDAIALDAPNNIYVADWRGLVVRMIDANGFVVSVAGDNARKISADGIGASANFFQVSGLVYSNGKLYAADKTCVREITVTGYSIDKPLPSGLVFDSATGTISGTPNAVTPASQYTIIGYNTGGSYATTISISVDPPPPPIITYPTPEVYTRNSAISPLAPTNTGGAASPTGTSAGYTIDRQLPPGLTLDPTTGVISGTPAAIWPSTDYTITAHNEGGAGSFIVNITVVAPILPDEMITFNPFPVKTYGDPDFAPGATSNDNGVPIAYASDDPAVATVINGQIHITGAGTANIEATQPGDNNYNAAFPVIQPLTVKPFPLTITVDDQTRFFGQPNREFTFSYSPFAYNENASYLTTQPVATTIATQTSAPGQYVINISGATSNNYKITQLPGTLTIKQSLPTVVIPNAFTPNGDGINDLWNIKSIEAYPKCLVSVYSRYGSLVYQSRGYARSWDGTSNGTPLPTGTYYYIINLNEGESLPLTGYVALIR